MGIAFLESVTVRLEVLSLELAISLLSQKIISHEGLRAASPSQLLRTLICETCHGTAHDQVSTTYAHHWKNIRISEPDLLLRRSSNDRLLLYISR